MTSSLGKLRQAYRPGTDPASLTGIARKAPWRAGLNAGGRVFNPLDLYQSGDVLLWYDPSDLSTMFQDTAGTIPVTADGQSVALILDKGPGGHHRVQAVGPSMPKYKTDGTLHWLLYDGSDDSHQTSAINWGSGEAALCTGLTKSSDAASALFFEFGANTTTFEGTFYVSAPESSTGRYFGFGWNGSAGAGNNGRIEAAAAAAPTTRVITSLWDMAGATVAEVIRAWMDGAAQSLVSPFTVLGGGDFGDYALNFGRRNNTSSPFNGHEYQTVIRNRLYSDAERSAVETYVAAKTGVSL